MRIIRLPKAQHIAKSHDVIGGKMTFKQRVRERDEGEKTLIFLQNFAIKNHLIHSLCKSVRALDSLVFFSVIPKNASHS